MTERDNDEYSVASELFGWLLLFFMLGFGLIIVAVAQLIQWFKRFGVVIQRAFLRLRGGER